MSKRVPDHFINKFQNLVAAGAVSSLKTTEPQPSYSEDLSNCANSREVRHAPVRN